MTAKEKLYHLIDELPESELHTAERFLEYLRDMGRCDPVLQALANAPCDDEPETEEERKAVQEARDELARGEGIPWEEARKRLLGPKTRARR